MTSKLGINQTDINRARSLASQIAGKVQQFVTGYTTVAVERTLCRLLGIDGIDNNGVPLPNVVVSHIEKCGLLKHGVMYILGNAMLQTGMNPGEIASAIAEGTLDLKEATYLTDKEIHNALKPHITNALTHIKERRERRNTLINRLGEGARPYIYVIVATGNVYEDAIQAQAAARQGADIIAVIRTTGQSLLDYVPYGATTEGFGGTYATQENFRIIRRALD